MQRGLSVHRATPKHGSIKAAEQQEEFFRVLKALSLLEGVL